MNILDVIIVVLMVFLIVRGVMRGLVAEVASLVGIVLGIWLGIRYMNHATTLLKPYVPEFSFLPVVSFALIFLGVLVLCNLLGWGLRVLFKKTLLGWLDRTLGAALAVIKGVVISYLGIVILTVYLVPGTPLVAQSRLAPAVTTSFQLLKNTISPERIKGFKDRFSARCQAPGQEALNKTEGTPETDGQP